MKKTTAVKAIFEDGVFKPKDPVTLEERTEVDVLIPSEPTTYDDDDPTGWKTARELIGFIENTPEGGTIADDHDEDIYE